MHIINESDNSKKMSELRELCLKYTSLTDNDIEIIENINKTIQFIADSTGCDVFLDCPTSHIDEAIVVAEAKPSNQMSLYKEKVVGKLALRQNEPAVLRAIDIGMSGRNIKGISQEQIMIKQSVEPIKNSDGQVIAILIIEQDVTENLDNNRKIAILTEANEELTNQIAIRNEDRYISYFINDAILIFNKDGVLKFKNNRAEMIYKKLGYNEDILGMSFLNLSVVDLSFEEVISNSSIDSYEVTIAGMCLQIKYIVQNGKSLNLVVIIKDITDMKEKEKELILKSVAIKEIHHRVKNNLQTIASLLRLQSRRINSGDFQDAMNESINRILSIAATHEILSKVGIDKVNIKEVINGIKYNMVVLEKRDCINLNMNITGDDIMIDSDNSTSIALIVNELIQNAIKHAFKGRTSGDISIVVEQGDTYSMISVIDNGIGFDMDKISKNSLGLMIVKSLVFDKLEGNLNIYSGAEGTKVVFDFKNK